MVLRPLTHCSILWLLPLWLGHAAATAQDTAPRPGTYQALLADVPAGRLAAGFDLGRWPRDDRYVAGAPEVVADVQGTERKLFVGPVTRRLTRRDGTAAVLVEMHVSRTAAIAIAYLGGIVTTSMPARGVRRIDRWLGNEHVLFVPATGAVPDRGQPPVDVASRRANDAPAGARLAYSWAIFKVHNIVVRVRAVPAGVPSAPSVGATDVWDLTEALGTELAQLPPVETVVLPGEPTIGLRGANGEQANKCVAGESLLLDLPESVTPRHLVKWIVGGDGHGYVEKDEQGVRRLWTTGDGGLAVTAVVTDPMGLSVAHTRFIEVTPEAGRAEDAATSRPGK